MYPVSKNNIERYEVLPPSYVRPAGSPPVDLTLIRRHLIRAVNITLTVNKLRGNFGTDRHRTDIHETSRKRIRGVSAPRHEGGNLNQCTPVLGIVVRVAVRFWHCLIDTVRDVGEQTIVQRRWCGAITVSVLSLSADWREDQPQRNVDTFICQCCLRQWTEQTPDFSEQEQKV